MRGLSSEMLHSNAAVRKIGILEGHRTLLYYGSLLVRCVGLRQF